MANISIFSAGDIEKIELNKDVLIEQLSMLCVAMQEMDVDRSDSIVSLLKGFDFAILWIRKTVSDLHIFLV